jgi:serine O-acetyltransferase
VVVGAGAKILGPILIGEGARIGSNAVVVKEVPAGATAIGIPARIIEAEAAPNGRFAAYAVVKDLNDPMAKAVHELIGHSADIDRRLEHLLAELKRLGGKIEDCDGEKLDANSLNKMVD